MAALLELSLLFCSVILGYMTYYVSTELNFYLV